MTLKELMSFHGSLDSSGGTLDLLPIGFIFLLTVASGRFLAFFWPHGNLRPSSIMGALFGLVQALLYSGMAFYISYNVLTQGYMSCVPGRRSNCGGMFYGSDMRFHYPRENLVSMGNQPLSFWIHYFFLFALTVLLIAWAFVCIDAMLTRRRSRKSIGHARMARRR